MERRGEEVRRGVRVTRGDVKDQTQVFLIPK